VHRQRPRRQHAERPVPHLIAVAIGAVEHALAPPLLQARQVGQPVRDARRQESGAAHAPRRRPRSRPRSPRRRAGPFPPRLRAVRRSDRRRAGAAPPPGSPPGWRRPAPGSRDSRGEKRLRGRPASIISTRRRARASCIAADNPAKLPPTTIASYIAVLHQ
jgi:hypothetical protein